MPVVGRLDEQGLHRVVGHALGAEVAVLGRVHIVPQRDEAVGIFVARLVGEGVGAKRRGLGKVRDLHLQLRLVTQRLRALRRRRALAGRLGCRLPVLDRRNARGAGNDQRQREGAAYSHPMNSTSSTQMSKSAPALLTCHCMPKSLFGLMACGFGEPQSGSCRSLRQVKA